MFIYLRDGNLFLTIPIIGGVDIATDNTCKTFKVIKKFIENVEDELDFFQNILKISDDDNSEMIRQIQNYKGLLKILVQQNAFNNIDEYDFNSTGLSKVLKELNCMVLDPQTYRDNFLKSTPEFNTFSLAHKRFGDQNYNTQSTFGLKLRQEIGKVKSIEVKTPTVDEFINDINKGNLKGIEIRGGDSEEVLNYFKSLWLGLEWPEDKWDSAKNIIQKALDQLYKYVYYHQNFAIDSDDITGLMSNLRDNWFLIFRDNLNSIAKDILSSPLEEQVKIDKISVLVQFFIANANIYLKDINPSTLNIGARLDQDKDLSETFSKLITTTLSNGNDVEDAILEFLHEEGLLKNITPEQKQEIKNLFYARYNTIKDSRHFDEFFILPRNTKSNWFSYGGAFSLELGYFASKQDELHTEYVAFTSEQHQKFASLTREDDNSLPFVNLEDYFGLNTDEILVSDENIAILEKLASIEYKPAEFIFKQLAKRITFPDTINEETAKTAAIMAIKYNNCDLLKKVIESNHDLSSIVIEGETALNWAISKDYIELAIILASGGADLNTPIKQFKRNLHSSYHTPLCYAIKKRSRELVKALIDNGADLNKNTGNTYPIFLAINEDEDIALDLIKANVNLDVLNELGQSPLFSALRKEDRDNVALELIERKAGINTKNSHGSTPLLEAIYRKEKPHIYMKLLDAGAIVNNGDQPDLILAAARGRFDCVKLYTERGYDISITGCYGENALHETSRADIIEYLIEKGLNPNATDKYGNTPLWIAIFYRRTECVDILLKNSDIHFIRPDTQSYLTLAIIRQESELALKLIEMGIDINSKCSLYGETALHLAITRKTDEVALKIIDKMSDISMTDNYNSTPLHEAVRLENLEISQALLQRNPDLNTQDKNGITPLHIAVKTGNIDIIKALIERNDLQYPGTGLFQGSKTLTQADLNIKTHEGKTALHLAILNRQDDIAKLLIENGANLDTKDNEAKTALHLAIEDNQDELAKLLIEKGAVIDTQDNDGQTALHYALRKGKNEIVQLLLEKGADLNIQTRWGSNALHVAIYAEQDDIAKLLIEKGANLDIKDNIGDTALHYASRKGKNDIVQLLIENGANINIKNIWGEAAYQDNTTTIIAITTVIVVAAFVTLGLLIPPLGLIFFGVAIGSFGIGITAWASYPRINNSKIVNSENTPLTSPVVRTGKQTTSDTELSTIDNSNEPRPGS